jgi:AcrR family transcriptional regulator
VGGATGVVNTGPEDLGYKSTMKRPGTGNSHGTGPRSRGSESRDAILRAARRLFAQRGYQGTSLASIAKDAQLSQPGLLHHYPSKADLLLAVLASRDSESLRLSSPKNAGKGIGIIDGLGALVEHNQSDPQSVRLFSTLLGEALAPDHPANDYFVHRYDTIRSRFVNHLRDAQAAGELDPHVDAEALASLLIAVMDGLQFQWLLDDSVDMNASYQTLAKLIRSSLPSDHAPSSAGSLARRSAHDGARPATQPGRQEA